jgi:ankyrin repeat protein
MEGRFSMSQDQGVTARRSLPARPNLEHLKNEAKQRLKSLRAVHPDTRLAAAQLAVARDYGFASWRQLKAHVDRLAPAGERKRIFAAARAGDVDTVRRAFLDGFDPAATDADGRSIHQIGKAAGHVAIELLAREFQERETRPADLVKAINGILSAAEHGRVEQLRERLDAQPELIDARGDGIWGRTALHMAAWRNRPDCIRLLLERGANVRIRDYGDNAYALHFAAEAADLAAVEMLVEAGSDTVGEGDDHQLGVVGWATCFARVREDVARYLLDHGGELNLWSAIALDREDAVRSLVTPDPACLRARMSRNEHHRTPLHHAAAKDRPRIVRLLLELGADPHASDAGGSTPLTIAAQEHADPDIVTMLVAAGAKLDFRAAVSLRQYAVAEAMLKEDPSRIGMDGSDTVMLHLAVARKDAETVRWLIQHGVDVNASCPLWDCNQTALHATAGDDTVDIARMLLDAGADPNIRDGKYEATVLGWAEYFENPGLAQLVRERGGVT